MAERMILAEEMNKLTLDDVAQLAAAARGHIDNIYLHWTAGHYGQCYDGYHLCIDKDGSIYQTCECLTEYHAHTWHRNTGAVGVAVMCCPTAMAYNGYDADFGDEGPTEMQIESLAMVVKTLCEGLGLPITQDTIMTHCEAAELDEYGPGSGDPETRWDLWYLPNYQQGREMQPGGDLIRGKAAYYARQG